LHEGQKHSLSAEIRFIIADLEGGYY